MRAFAIIIVIINNLIWFIASIGTLNNFLKGIVPIATKPTVFHVVISFVMLAMNVLVLIFVLKKTDENVSPRKEVNMKKVFIGLGWFVIIYFVSSFVIGMIIGAMAGSAAATPAAGAEPGKLASINFFNKFGGVVLLTSVIVAITGTITGNLPFTKDEQD